MPFFILIINIVARRIKIEEVIRKYSDFFSAWGKISKSEYKFILKDLPDSPWILNIRAVKPKNFSGYYTKSKLKSQSLKTTMFFGPKYIVNNPDQAIIKTLQEFILPMIKDSPESIINIINTNNKPID